MLVIFDAKDIWPHQCKLLAHSLVSERIASKLALFHKWILWRVGFFLEAWALKSQKTISWSASLGMPSQPFTSDGRLVRRTSSVLSSRVGKSMVCSRPVLASVRRKDSLILFLYWWPTISSVAQLMSVWATLSWGTRCQWCSGSLNVNFCHQNGGVTIFLSQQLFKIWGSSFN